MTKQEAIIILKCIKAENLNLDNVYIKDRHDALTIAIEMLEKKVSEPWCEGCKEHDKEHHCCHRYSSFIRYSLTDSINAVLEDIKEEVDELETEDVTYYDGTNKLGDCTVLCKDEVIEIIDKYIKEEEL